MVRDRLGIIFNTLQGISSIQTGNLVGEARRFANRKSCSKGGNYNKERLESRGVPPIVPEEIEKISRTIVDSRIFLAVLLTCRTRR